MSTTTSVKPNRRWPRWLPWTLGLLLVIAASYAIYQSGLLGSVLGTSGRGAHATTQNAVFTQSATGATTLAAGSTVAIRTASDLGAVSAAGNLELASERPVVVLTSGLVEEVIAGVGDTLKAGDPIARLGSSDQQMAVKQALLNLSSAQAAYDALLEPAGSADIAVAEANLKSAQESLADVMDGPGAAELAAAYSSLASAQAGLTDIQAAPTADELTQLSANLRTAEVAVQEAQRAYDQVSWHAEVGMTSQASNLQQATIAYESAQAAYAEATAPASDADVQSSMSQVSSAQSTLNTLLAQPSAAEVAAAEAKVRSAEADLADLLDGSDASSLESARVQVEQAKLDLESAAEELARTEIVAPQDGTVLSTEIEVGAQVASGVTVATLADISQLELTVSVAEVDVRNVAEGQTATVAIDALPDETFTGTVSRVSPTSDAESSVVTYDVTVALDAGDLSQVRAGMTAVATIQTSTGAAGWLAPTSSLVKGDGVTTITVVRGTQTIPVQVTVGETQGEWTVVQSDQLQEGDQVVGTLASDLSSDSSRFGGPPGGMMVGGPP